jgi:pilus assembly protein CpaF
VNTGHSGTLSTIHANSCAEALSCLSICVLQSDINLPYQAINRFIAKSLNIVVHLAREENGKRIVDEMIRIKNYNHRSGWYDLESILDSSRVLRAEGSAESKNA